MVEQLAAEHAGRLKVVALDAHHNYDTAAAFGIMGIPTLIFFKAGKEVARLVGAVPREKILAEMQGLLS